MRNTLYLYNHFHYGDIFTSRSLIKPLLTKFDIIFYHNLNVPLLPDLKGVTEIQGIPLDFDVNSSDFNQNKINAWIGQSQMKYYHRYESGCSLKNYLSFVFEVLDFYDIPKENTEYYLPEIDFNSILKHNEIKSQLENYKNQYKKIVFISNGDVHSGQSFNFNFSPIINILAQHYPEVLFLLSERKNIFLPNVKFTSDITLLTPDLLQISLISTFCDIIIGRASGPFTYSLVKENILDENKKFISFNYNQVEANYYNNLGFNLDWYSNYEPSFILNTIKNAINSK